jgi:hypothetical protein
VSIRTLSAARLAQRATDAAGAATLIIGLALVIAPDRAGVLLVLDPDRSRTRFIGCLDLVLAPGLLTDNRHRRSWMLARAALNAILAADYRRPAEQRRTQSRRLASRALAALSITDAMAGLSLPLPPDRDYTWS